MGKEVFNRYTPTRSVITEKYDRNIAAQNFFLGFLEDFEFGKSKDSYYKDWVFWLKNDVPFMCLNPKNREIWVDSKLIWRKLEVDFCMNYDEVQSFIQHQVLHSLNIDHITPPMTMVALLERCYIV